MFRERHASGSVPRWVRRKLEAFLLRRAGRRPEVGGAVKRWSSRFAIKRGPACAPGIIRGRMGRAGRPAGPPSRGFEIEFHQRAKKTHPLPALRLVRFLRHREQYPKSLWMWWMISKS